MDAPALSRPEFRRRVLTSVGLVARATVLIATLGVLSRTFYIRDALDDPPMESR